MIERAELAGAVDAVSRLAKKQNVEWDALKLSSASRELCENVAGMIAATPDPGANPVGRAARAALVKYIEKSTPGQFNWGFWGQKSAFDAFYGGRGWNEAPFTPNVPEATGKAAGWWQGFSITATCDALYRAQTNEWDRIEINAVRGDLAQFNKTLVNEGGAAHAQRWYAYVLARSYAAFSDRWTRTSDKEGARTLYTATLESPQWQENVKGKLANPIGDDPNDPTIKDFAWFVYHHWTKLYVMGASYDEIDAVANRLPPELMTQAYAGIVGAKNWVNYITWLQRSGSVEWQIDGSDIVEDAGAGLRASYLRSQSDSSGGAIQKEMCASAMFIEGPGSKYFHHDSGGGGSCFAAGALVRMGDGSLKAIENVRSGDEVSSQGGTRRVALLAKPFRAGRPLCAVNGRAFWFTPAHPFFHPSASIGDAPTFAALEPHRLGRTVPTLADLGIGEIGPGGQLLRYGDTGDGVPIAVESIVTAKAPPDDPDERLYDVLLEPDESGLFPYFVGDAHTQFLVASELPLIQREPLAAAAVLRVLAVAAPALRQHASTMSRHAFERVARRVVEHGLNFPQLAEDAWRSLEDRRPSDDNPLPRSVAEAVAEGMRAFVSTDEKTGAEDYDWRLGRLFELLMMYAARPLIAAIRHGHVPVSDRSDEGARLLVTPHQLSLAAPHSESEIHVNVTLTTADDQEQPSRTIRATRSGTPFAYQCDGPVDLPLPADGTRAPDLVLSCGALAGGPAFAHVPLPHLEQMRYQAVSTSLLSPSGAILAGLNVDLRLVPSVLTGRTHTAPATEAEAFAFAEALGLACGQAIARGFADADARSEF